MAIDTIEIGVREVRRGSDGIDLEWTCGGRVGVDHLPRATLIGHARKRHLDAAVEDLEAAVDRYLAAEP